MLNDRKRLGLSGVANLAERFFNEWINPNRSFAVSELLFLFTDPRFAEADAGASWEEVPLDAFCAACAYSRE